MRTLDRRAGFMGLIDMSDVQAALSFVALGVSLNPLVEDPDGQDYIVRPIVDLEKDGPIMLSEPVRPGQIVRFHVRDAENAKVRRKSPRACFCLCCCLDRLDPSKESI